MNEIIFLYIVFIICILLFASYLKKAKIDFNGTIGAFSYLNTKSEIDYFISKFDKVLSILSK